ncbi:MAG: argininosuccinate lyase [Clostridiales bacterium]|nr:argininosuccinate lyase [Clostridiales bacterium]
MKLWGGRFEKETSQLMDDFHSSISFDQRLYAQDIRGSQAHARMLCRQGIISQEDEAAIQAGLAAILADMEAGKVDFPASSEDIHMHVEKLLTERIGDAGKRLHTGRSRNDQVAVDMHLYAMATCEDTLGLLKELEELLLSLAKKHASDVMPGYTHLQRAQPITLGHHLMAYFEMFRRDMIRVQHAYDAADYCPLGSGALAGTTYPLDRAFTARELGFENVSGNSLDGVSDRDFLLEYLSAASIGMMHLSRFCEEMVLWSSLEFGFVTLDDGFATGSSMMPQKKNPDAAELIRGKTGRVYGDLMGLLTVMKGLPLAYNKDMQEDKEAFFDGRDTWMKCLHVFTEILRTATFRTANMYASANAGFANATDCADYLVKKGVPFRDAHGVVGQLVALCLSKGCAIDELSLQELQALNAAFDADVYEAIALKTCVAARNLIGGPAPERVLAEVEAGEKWLREQ